MPGCGAAEDTDGHRRTHLLSPLPHGTLYEFLFLRPHTISSVSLATLACVRGMGGGEEKEGGWGGGLRSVCGVEKEEEGRGEAVRLACVVCLGGTGHVVGSHEAGGGDWQKGDGHRHAHRHGRADRRGEGGEIDKCEGAVVLARRRRWVWWWGGEGIVAASRSMSVITNTWLCHFPSTRSIGRQREVGIERG